jgi:hypothetical protein
VKQNTGSQTEPVDGNKSSGNLLNFLRCIVEIDVKSVTG